APWRLCPADMEAVSSNMWFLRKRNGGLRGAGACVLLCACLNAPAQEAAPTEYQVKAAFLYNFGKYVEWPPGVLAADSFAICVLGDDPFGSALDRIIEGKSVQGRKLVAYRLGRVEDSGKCQVLFVSASENGRLAHILAALRDRRVLTVGDTVGFAQRGGVINFQLEGSKVRFEINLDAAERAGLTVSSQLLKLAKVIRESSQSGM
ncbi:MAG: YfiR family protein, partial [Terriglobales bacterium]